MGTSVVRWLLCTVAAAPAAATAAPCRDPILQPFSSASIWNTPIGSGAVYAPTIPNESDPSSSRSPAKHPQRPRFLCHYAGKRPTHAGWTRVGGARATTHAQLGRGGDDLFPHDWTSASDGGRSAPWQSNNAMAILLQTMSRSFKRSRLTAANPEGRCLAAGGTSPTAARSASQRDEHSR